MVGATPAPTVHEPSGPAAEFLGFDFAAADLLEPRDYQLADKAYRLAAHEIEHPADAEALNGYCLERAVDAAAPAMGAAVLERLYRRLMAIADRQVSDGRLDAFEFGLRVAATEARAMGRELSGGLR